VVVAVVVVATGGREAPGGWWGGLSVPKPPKGVVVADSAALELCSNAGAFFAGVGSSSACAVWNNDSAPDCCRLRANGSRLVAARAEPDSPIAMAATAIGAG
jgi:hypothetical protein